MEPQQPVATEHAFFRNSDKTSHGPVKGFRQDGLGMDPSSTMLLKGKTQPKHIITMRHPKQDSAQHVYCLQYKRSGYQHGHIDRHRPSQRPAAAHRLPHTAVRISILTHKQRPRSLSCSKQVTRTVLHSAQTAIGPQPLGEHAFQGRLSGGHGLGISGDCAPARSSTNPLCTHLSQQCNDQRVGAM